MAYILQDEHLAQHHVLGQISCQGSHRAQTQEQYLQEQVPNMHSELADLLLANKLSQAYTLKQELCNLMHLQQELFAILSRGVQAEHCLSDLVAQSLGYTDKLGHLWNLLAPHHKLRHSLDLAYEQLQHNVQQILEQNTNSHVELSNAIQNLAKLRSKLHEAILNESLHNPYFNLSELNPSIQENSSAEHFAHQERVLSQYNLATQDSLDEASLPKDKSDMVACLLTDDINYLSQCSLAQSQKTKQSLLESCTQVQHNNPKSVTSKTLSLKSSSKLQAKPNINAAKGYAVDLPLEPTTAL